MSACSQRSEPQREEIRVTKGEEIHGLEIRKATRDDVGRMVELMRAGLGEGTLERSADVWRWKHEESPFGVSEVIVAEVEGRMIGLRAFMRWNFCEGGVATASAVRAVDTVTHPDWQGRGLFTRLTRRLCDDVAAQGTDFVFNTPNAKSRPGYLKMGWQDLGRITVWGRAVGPRWRRAVEARPAREVLAGVEVAPRADEGLHTRVTSTYLRWRYGAVPGLDYRVAVEDDAVAVGRVRTRRGLREAMVCEVVPGQGLGGIARAAHAVRRLGRSLDASYAIAVAPLGSARAAALALAGFAPVPRVGPHFTVRPLQSAGASQRALRLRGWALSLGDVELF